MSSFLSNIGQRATNPAHYQTLKGKTFSQGMGYLYMLLTLLSCITTIVAVIGWNNQIPVAKTYVEVLKEQLLQIYPNDLVLTLKDGELSSNKPNPYFIELPERWKAAFSHRSEKIPSVPEIEHLVAIDTTASSEDFLRYNSIVLLTKTSAIIPDKNSTLKVLLLSSLKKDVVLTHDEYQRLMRQALPYLDYAIPAFKIFMVLAIIIGPWLVSSFTLIGYLLLSLVCAAVVWILATILWKGPNYSEILTLSLYGLTLPLLLQCILSLLNITAPVGVFSLLFIIWMMVIVRRVRA